MGAGAESRLNPCDERASLGSGPIATRPRRPEGRERIFRCGRDRCDDVLRGALDALDLCPDFVGCCRGLHRKRFHFTRDHGEARTTSRARAADRISQNLVASICTGGLGFILVILRSAKRHSPMRNKTIFDACSATYSGTN